MAMNRAFIQMDIKPGGIHDQQGCGCKYMGADVQLPFIFTGMCRASSTSSVMMTRRISWSRA